MVCRSFVLACTGLILVSRSARADDFATGTDNWSFSQTTAGYQMTWNQSDGNSPPSLCVSGDYAGGGETAGFEKTYSGVTKFAMSFDWRAQSATAASIVTNMSMLILRVSDNAVLYDLPLLEGTVTDSGWLKFPPTNLSHVLGGALTPTDIKVRFTLSDGWAANWSQSICLDNFVFTTSPPPPPAVLLHTDDFASSLDDWSFWSDTTSSYTYALLQDMTAGNQAPSAKLWGHYAYTGQSTDHFGMEKTITVVSPFVVSFDRSSPAPVAFQMFDMSGKLRSSMFLPATPNGTFEHYGAVDFTSTVSGLTEVKVRLSQIGSSSADSGFWIDNFSYSTDCAQLADGAPCLDDNDPCTGDICKSGTCSHEPMPCGEGGSGGTGGGGGGAGAGTEPGAGGASTGAAGGADAGTSLSAGQTPDNADQETGGSGDFRQSGCSCNFPERSDDPLTALAVLACALFVTRRRPSDL